MARRAVAESRIGFFGFLACCCCRRGCRRASSFACAKLRRASAELLSHAARAGCRFELALEAMMEPPLFDKLHAQAAAPRAVWLEKASHSRRRPRR